MLIVIFHCHRLSVSADGQDFFTSYDEVCDTFDAMGLQEKLLRGIYAYGKDFKAILILKRCFLTRTSYCISDSSS